MIIELSDISKNKPIKILSQSLASINRSIKQKSINKVIVKHSFTLHFVNL